MHMHMHIIGVHQGDDFETGSNLCKQGWKNHSAVVMGRGEGGVFHHLGRINHYSRSLEKFALKAQSWHTATGDNAEAYDLAYFLHRSVGFTQDHSALKFRSVQCVWKTNLFRPSPDANKPTSPLLPIHTSHYVTHMYMTHSLDARTPLTISCQTRAVIKEELGLDAPFLRFGDNWYRNIEFGKNVSDPMKRGRNGNARKERVIDGNPYLYDGTVPPLVKGRNSGGLSHYFGSLLGS